VNNTHDALVNDSIKNNVEKTGFFVIITKKEDSKQRLEKSEKRPKVTNIEFFILVF